MVALITGASRGIGETIALELGRLGFDLALVGRDRESLEEIAGKAEGAGHPAGKGSAAGAGIRTCCIVADLSKVEADNGIVEETAKAQEA